MGSINPEIKKIIVYIIKSFYKNKLGRPLKYDVEHYLDVIIYVLQSDIKWKYLEKPLHYDSYRKTFQKWNELNIFQLCNDVIIKLLNNKKLMIGSINTLYMDSSDILNKLGIDITGASKKYNFKKATKVNIITDNRGFILTAKIFSANTNDATTTEITLNELPIKLKTSNRYPKYLVTDKGYNSAKVKKNINDKCKMVYKEKANVKNHVYTEKEIKFNRKLLKTRYINENCFSWIKNYKRLMIRCDRKSINFNGFIFLGILINNSNKINRHNYNIF
jgi:transposase